MIDIALNTQFDVDRDDRLRSGEHRGRPPSPSCDRRHALWCAGRRWPAAERTGQGSTAWAGTWSGGPKNS